jgi:hypothetical protein
MRFAYRPYHVNPSPADPASVSYRPDLRVRVCGSGGPADGIPSWGVLDVAAIDCILPYEAADRIKPTWCGGMRAITDFAGGSRAVRYGRVHFQVQIGRQRVRWPAVVAFRRDLRDALWGRCGFLDHFSVTFNGPARHFIIRLRGSPAPGFEVDDIPRAKGRSSKHGDVVSPDDQSP